MKHLDHEPCQHQERKPAYSQWKFRLTMEGSDSESVTIVDYPLRLDVATLLVCTPPYVECTMHSRWTCTLQDVRQHEGQLTPSASGKVDGVPFFSLAEHSRRG